MVLRAITRLWLQRKGALVSRERMPGQVSLRHLELNPCLVSIFKATEDGTVKMQPMVHWKDIDLQWKDELLEGDGNVVVGNFKKDD